jgi:hypothetical protein
MILSWVTILIVAVVVVSGMANAVTLVQPGQRVAALQVLPAEAALCPGQEVTFSIEPPLEDAEWAATGGGEISQQGRYVAGQPGDFEIVAAGSGGERGRAVVHVIACTPTPTPTPTSTPTPTPTATPVPITSAEADPRQDVGSYSTGAPVSEPPAGVDIRNASVDDDRRVVLGGTEDLPPELTGWMQEGEAVLWIALYEPIPASMPVRSDWLFVLDLDGDTATGRLPGSRSINPDLGDEAAIGVYYDPLGGAYVPYLLVWDPAVEDWAEESEAVRYWINDERTLVALAVPLELLEEQVAQITGVTLVPEAVAGRAGAVAYTDPEAAVDFYPDLPE